MTKTCSNCKREKDLSDFQKNKNNKDGLCSRCRDCNNAFKRLDRQLRPNARERDRRNYYASEERRKVIRRGAAKSVSPLKTLANRLLHLKIKKGEIIRPTECSYCGEAYGKIEAHHPDYHKPYEVVWVCVRCHRILDGRTVIAVPYIPLPSSNPESTYALHD